MDKPRPHIYAFDALRVLCALGVVFLHAAASGLRAGLSPQWQVLNLLASLASSAVPLFFMMSGYLLFSNPATAKLSTLGRRLVRLCVSLATWTVLTALWRCLGAASPLRAFALDLLRALRGPLIQPLWFQYTLIGIYLLSPLLYAGLQRAGRPGRAMVLALILLFSLRGMLRAVLPAAWESKLGYSVLPAFQAFVSNLLLCLLGYFLGSWKRKLPDALLLCAALGTWLLIALGTWLKSRAAGSYVSAFQSQSAGFDVLLASCLFLLARQRLERPSRMFGALAPLTLAVYLMHGLVLLIFASLGLASQRLGGILLETAAATILCCLIARTLASLRPLCFLFTGRPYASGIGWRRKS